jgi:hypothetical protein
MNKSVDIDGGVYPAARVYPATAFVFDARLAVRVPDPWAVLIASGKYKRALILGSITHTQTKFICRDLRRISSPLFTHNAGYSFVYLLNSRGVLSLI